MAGVTECRSPRCDALILWVAHRTSGTRHPLDFPATADQPGPGCQHAGNLAVRPTGRGVFEYRVLGAGDELAGDEHRATSHFATCPDAGRFRDKCPACHHQPHPSGPCRKTGPVTCRPVPGAGRVRGAWPCDCRHGLPTEEPTPT